jgi:hypothetical protein
VACIAILVVAHRRRRASAARAIGVHDDLGVSARAEAHWPTSYGAASSSVRRTLGAAAAIGVVTAVCSRPWIGLTAAAVTFLVGCVPRARPLVVAAIPALLAASRLWHRPALAWLAIALLVTDLVGLWLHRRRADVTPPRTSAPSLPEAEPRRA